MVNVSPPLNSSPKLTEYLEETAALISTLDFLLAGKEQVLGIDDEGNRGYFWKPVTRPLVNERGRHAIRSMLETVANKNTHLSHLEQSRVPVLAERAVLSTLKHLFYNQEEYAIRDADFGLIHQQIATVIEMSLRRAMIGGEKKFLEALAHESITSESRENMQDPSYRGIFSKKT